jgi:hypothetical protein
VVQAWVSANGTLEQSFNASDASSWNATGNILTNEQASRIGMTDFERAVVNLYVPAMVVFFVIIVIYVLSKSNNRGGM